jgi:hypothetical protein
MNHSPVFTASNMHRRTLLRAAGTCLALPLLNAMLPKGRAAEGQPISPRRMIGIQTNQGILPQYFFPTETGQNYTLTPYLERLSGVRNQFTVFSGVSLPGVDGGHAADKCFLTGTPHPAQGGFRNGISLDQFASESLGNATRFPSLVLAMTGESRTLSYTRSGAAIPADQSPRKVFEKLFLQGKPSEVEERVETLRQGRSTLDFIGDESKRLQAKLGKADQQRVDEYFTSVRELERRMHAAQEWETRPKPRVDAQPPVDITDSMAFAARTKQMFEVMKLALETDSTRFMSLFVDTTQIHNLTHHGNRPEVLAELRGHEASQFDALGHFLNALSASSENGVSLLDRTMVLYGTCMGSANSHSNVNLPVLLAGGGFKHGQHLAFDTKSNYPLTNLYVSMLRQLGMPADAFATSTGPMKGLTS